MSPSGKGVGEEITRHAEADHCNLEEGSIRFRVQARQARQKFMEEKREKGIVSFLEKQKESARMKIPPLSYTFRLTGFINLEASQGKDKEILMDKAFGSLSIDMIEVEDLEAMSTKLPPFPRGRILDNWIAIELLVVFKLSND